jgi:hypothetical protein
MSNAWSVLRGKKPADAAHMMLDQNSADHRRQGIYRLVQYDFAQRPPYTKMYQNLASTDADFTVRAAAVRALNWSRDQSAAPVFITALGDKSELVRWEAAKALINVPDPSALAALTRAVSDANESKDVRIAAADALQHYRNLNSARALVSTLGGKDFGVAWQARQSLHAMTGADYRYDESAWLDFLSRNMS